MKFLNELDATPPEQRWQCVRQWMREHPLALFAELRCARPVLVLPGLVAVTRFVDCSAVLRQHDVFSVAPYKPKQGEFWMAQDDTPGHWREKGVMRGVLDLERLPEFRRFVAERTATLLDDAGGHINAVDGIGRAVPIAVVQEKFGFDESDPAKLVEWSYWNQFDAFHNQPFDAPFVADQGAVVANRERSNQELKGYVAGLLQRRGAELQAGNPRDDIPTRLLRLSLSGALKFDPARVGQNVGGLLIGAVETTSHAVVNALYVLLNRPDVLPHAVAAAHAEDPSACDGFVFEALRFMPAFPYMFRQCERNAVLASGTVHATEVTAGTPVLAMVHSAMFDEAAFPGAHCFDPTRPQTNAFHFGHGMHECLGRHIGYLMIAEIVRQVLRLNGLHATGPLDRKSGPVPESYPLAWECSGP